MKRRCADTLRGLCALGGLILLVAAPPLALAQFVGWPLPTQIASLDEVSRAVRGGLDDMVMLKALAVLAWLIWAQLALATAVEVVGLVRGRVPRRAPVLSGLQTAVGRLVTTAAMVVAAWGPPRGAPVPIAQLAAAVTQPLRPSDVAPVVAVTLPQARVAPQHSAVEPVHGATYVVRRNDSWWGIAEKHLGDGGRWRELRSLNAGRPMTDGSVIADTTEVIRPGWELVVPEGAAPAAAPVVPTAAAEEMEVQRGDNLWVMAERHLERAEGHDAADPEVTEHWVDVIEANRDRFVDASNPSLIYPDQVMAMPAVPGAPAGNGQTPSPNGKAVAAPPPPPPPTPTVPPPPERTGVPTTAPVTPSTTSSATSTSTSTSSTTATTSTLPPHTADVDEGGSKGAVKAAPASPDRSARDGAGVPVALLGTASTMLAVGIASAVDRRRRRRRLQLPRRAQEPTPPPELDEVRAELAAGADIDHADRLHCALRDVATALAAQRSAARPRLVQVDRKHTEVLLSEPVPAPPAPWRAEAGGAAWVLKGEPLDRNVDGAAPTPALVTIGRSEDGAEIYLDLEAEGIIALSGDPDAVAGAVRSWVLELATSPLSAGASVVVVGDDSLAPSAASDRVTTASDWGEIAEEALTWVEQSAQVLTAHRWPTPVAGRIRSRQGDNLAPLVVVLATRPTDERFDRLCAAISEKQVTVSVVVMNGDAEMATRVELTAEEIRIPSLGLACRPQSISAAVAEKVEELMADAEEVPAQLDFLPVAVAGEAAGTARGADFVDRPQEILVRLLGDISVVGAARELKPKQLAVLAYIALHAPVASGRVEDALWVAPTASRRKRLANTVSDCRRAIGVAHLPMATDGRYRVGPGVVTDLELFDAKIAAATEQDDESATTTLRSALELVGGPAFTYRNADRWSYVWVDVENWVATWELKVTEAAEDLAERCLRIGDSKGAVWASRRGLKASPIHTRLTKLLMEAYFANGDAKAAERVFISYQAATEKLEMDDAELDAELVDFYYEARRTRGSAAS